MNLTLLLLGTLVGLLLAHLSLRLLSSPTPKKSEVKNHTLGPYHSLSEAQKVAGELLLREGLHFHTEPEVFSEPPALVTYPNYYVSYSLYIS